MQKAIGAQMVADHGKIDSWEESQSKLKDATKIEDKDKLDKAIQSEIDNLRSSGFLSDVSADNLLEKLQAAVTTADKL